LDFVSVLVIGVVRLVPSVSVDSVFFCPFLSEGAFLADVVEHVDGVSLVVGEGGEGLVFDYNCYGSVVYVFPKRLGFCFVSVGVNCVGGCNVVRVVNVFNCEFWYRRFSY